MDKNTITGFLLIAVVMIAFMVTQQPNEEQLRERKRIQDSIQQVELDRAKLQAELPKGDSSNIDEPDVVADFFGSTSSISEDTTYVSDTTVEGEAVVDTASSFIAADKSAAEEYITIENEDLRLKVSTKGG